ncbi:BPL-N domain-containing protein [Blastopirellula retiformator]
MLADSFNAATVFPEESGQDCIRVAVYDDKGAISSSGHGPAWLQAQLVADTKLMAQLVSREDILQGALNHADVLVVGGGHSNSQAKHLGESGRAAVQDFVRAGGGYVGICAGAFLATQPKDKYPYLGLMKVKSNGNSGSFVTPLQWSRCPLVESDTKEDAKYSGGPKLTLLDPTSVTVWASFDAATKTDPKGKAFRLSGTPAVVASNYGQGRLVCFSPHCERRPTDGSVFQKAVRWVAAAAPSEANDSSLSATNLPLK